MVGGARDHCDGVFPGFRRLRRRTVSSGSSDTARSRSGRLYEVLLKIPRGFYPEVEPPLYLDPRLGDNGGRTLSTTIRKGGSATTARAE